MHRHNPASTLGAPGSVAVVVVALLATLATLATLPACRKAEPIPAGQERIDWTPLFRGIELARIVADQPRPLRLFALRVDLRDPDVRITSSPPFRAAAGLEELRTANGELAEALSSTTSSFAKAAGCQVAFNASAYDPVVDEQGVPQSVEGLWIVDGVRVSDRQNRHDVWAFDSDKSMRFVHAPADVTDTANVVPGFEIVLEDGEVDIRNPDLAPRTAVGLSADRATLIVLLVDGRQEGTSEGLLLHELGLWLRRLGAHDGLNLDGGGSTTLVVREGDDVRVLNRPIHRKQPGRERPNANHICLVGAPLAEAR